MLNAHRLIRSITMVREATGANTGLRARLVVGRDISLPFVKPRTITVPISDITFSEPFFLHRSELQRVEAQMIQNRSQKANEFRSGNLMSLPFRQASYYLWRGFQLMRRMWTREDFIKVKINGHRGTCQLDRHGWALSDGQIIDRTFKRWS